MYELLCCKAKQLQNVEKSLKCIKIAVSLKSVKLTLAYYIPCSVNNFVFSVGVSLVCWGGRGKEEVSYLGKSLVDFSLSINVNVEAYHLRGAWKSQST